MSHARWTLPNCIWSYSFGYVSSSLWLSFTMKGNLCAYLRLTAPSTPNVEANGVAAALDGEAHEVLGVEVGGVRREARARRVLDALVDREDRHVARAGEAPRVHEPLEVAQHVAVAVAVDEDAVDEVGPGQVEQSTAATVVLSCWSRSAGVVAEQLLQA